MNISEHILVQSFLTLLNPLYLQYSTVDLTFSLRYGVRVTTEECASAVFLQSAQSIVGVIIQVLYVILQLSNHPDDLCACELLTT